MPDDPNILHYVRPRWLVALGVVVLCIAAAVIVSGLFSRMRADQTVAEWTLEQAVPTVSVVNPSGTAQARTLMLPGDVQAFTSAPVHSRVTGYLKKWYTDIGTIVKAGQPLAEIEIPDLDQQTAQAKANLAVAIANQKLAAITAKRWHALLKVHAVAPQDYDEKQGALEADIAATAAAQANVGQLDAEESFKTIAAPFDGIVTSRATDVGALITVGTPSDVPLFTVSDVHRLRIYVHVPQNYSALVKPGMSATFTVPQFPGRTFAATLAATADAVDATSGTLLAQFQIDNSDRALKPGDYAQMHFTVPTPADTMLLPASALIFREGGMSVAIVDRNGHVGIQRITIGRDLGTSVEIAAGLSRADRVIDNPPDSLRSGDSVRVASTANGRAPTSR